MKKIVGKCSECERPIHLKGLCLRHYKSIHNKMFRTKHPEKCRKYTRDWTIKLKYEIFSHYSGEQPKCAKCGFSDMRALCLDHIYNDGAEERRMITNGVRNNFNGQKIYQWVKKNNFPDRYQVLCFNCNIIKQRELSEKRN